MEYFKYTPKARLDKSINTLLGILEGIAADKTVSVKEWTLLGKWVEENNHLADRHPYNEIVPKLISAMSDGIVEEEEHQDLIWLCNQLRSTNYYDLHTADMERLHGILTAISSDGVISEAEVEKLSDWLGEHEHLRKCWPYDEVDSLITAAMKDRWIDPAEQKTLLEYFQSFTPQDLNFDIPAPSNNTLKGICAVAPEIVFGEHRFCFTGESLRASRDAMKGTSTNSNSGHARSSEPNLTKAVRREPIAASTASCTSRTTRRKQRRSSYQSKVASMSPAPSSQI